MLDLPPCVHDIAEYYQVEVQLIAAVQKAEGGKVGMKSGPVKGGTYDYGPMQINSWWFDERNTNNLLERGITIEDVQNNECTNYAVGAWILRLNFDWLGNWYDAVASYNRGSEYRKGYGYADTVFEHYESLPANNYR